LTGPSEVAFGGQDELAPFFTAPGSRNRLSRISLRAASLSSVAVWLAVWLLFLSLRFSSLDVRYIPGAGGILLCALVLSMLAPIVAVGLAAAALIRAPRVPANWLTLGLAGAALCCQALLFLSTRWL
jgi:hypothetical protein